MDFDRLFVGFCREDPRLIRRNKKINIIATISRGAHNVGALFPPAGPVLQIKSHFINVPSDARSHWLEKRNSGTRFRGRVYWRAGAGVGARDVGNARNDEGRQGGRQLFFVWFPVCVIVGLYVLQKSMREAQKSE